MKLAPGSVVGPYRVIELVGEGGMAAVYKAHHAALNRFVALKTLPPQLASDPEFRSRFRDEAQRVAALRHPNIPAIHDYGESDDVIYMASEFIDGGTLTSQLGMPLPVEYVSAILGPIAAAIDYAHSRGLLHRDIKPSNILLARDGTPLLTDFGVARMMSADLDVTQSGMILGTPQYMAPEQSAGTAAEESDNYSLAVIAYQMLTGRVPFTAPTPMAVLLAQQHDPLPLPRSINPQLSQAVEQVLLKGLARSPEDRYRRASDFVQALSEAVAGVADRHTKLLPSAGARVSQAVAEATAPGRAGRQGAEAGVGSVAGRKRPGHRRVWLVGSVLMVGLVIVGGVAYVTVAGHRSSSPAPASISFHAATWEQWQKIPGILDVQAISSGAAMIAMAQQGLALVDSHGTVHAFASGSGGFQATGNEPYIALSPGLHLTGCDFNADETFALDQRQSPIITRVDSHGHASVLAVISGAATLNGVVFDTGGKFGHRLMVVSDSQSAASVLAVDCMGRVTKLAGSAPKVEGGLAIAPAGFGSYGGDLIAADELDGKIYAIDSSGGSRQVADSGLPSGQDVGVESAAFVPAGFMAANGYAYIADRASPGSIRPGTDTLLRLTAAALKSAGVADGDLIAVTEGGGRTIDVRCNPTCSVREIGHASSAAHIEGHIAFLLAAA